MFELSSCLDEGVWAASPVMIPLAVFTIWMIVTAVRYRDWVWIVVMLVFPMFGAFYYFFFHVGSHATSGFQLPGAHSRKRVKELEADIHRLDKAYHHAQLGDVYFQLGKLAKAEASYRAALERDPTDVDARAHLGQALVRLGRPAEARPLLDGVIADHPRHEHGYTAMALAEALGALGERDLAIAQWKKVTASHTYARARVQLAEQQAAAGDTAAARAMIDTVLADDRHTPAFQRRRDRTWLRRARKLARTLRA